MFIQVLAQTCRHYLIIIDNLIIYIFYFKSGLSVGVAFSFLCSGMVAIAAHTPRSPSSVFPNKALLLPPWLGIISAPGWRRVFKR